MDIQGVLGIFPRTNPEDWRDVGGAWLHTDCDVDSFTGVFHGGVFRGGVFHGGHFYDGVFHGGAFHDGVFHGGTFRGGTFRGGCFCDGVFRGGVFHGGEFRGGEWHRSPVFVQGTKYPVVESDDGHIVSGCIRLPADRWTPEKIISAAEANGYSEEQVLEYQEIFRFVKSAVRRKHVSDQSS